MTEYEKMHNGMIYDCLTEEFGEVQKYSHRLCEQYNKLGVDDAEEKKKILRQLFPNDDFGTYRGCSSLAARSGGCYGLHRKRVRCFHSCNCIYV